VSPEASSQGGAANNHPEPVLVVAALVEVEGCVFLARRSPQAGSGGLWELPGGKVEAGEEPASALVREIREELGVGLSVLGASARYESRLRDRPFIFLVFPSRFEEGASFSLAAHDEWNYYRAEEIEGLDLAPLDAPALEDWKAGRFSR
jgi:ADP-ribose pyrophosphatase